MKTLLKFVAASAFLLTACTTQYQARTAYDDLYYSPKDAPAYSTVQPTTSSASQSNQTAADPGSYSRAENQQEQTVQP